MGELFRADNRQDLPACAHERTPAWCFDSLEDAASAVVIADSLSVCNSVTQQGREVRSTTLGNTLNHPGITPFGYWFVSTWSVMLLRGTILTHRLTMSDISGGGSRPGESRCPGDGHRRGPTARRCAPGRALLL